MKEIQLTKGFVALVDDEDFHWINQWKWCYANGYARRRQYVGNGRYVSFSMHRFIIGLETNDGKIVDHINGEKTDNRKSNLRICSNAQNKSNCKQYANNKSGYKGVYKEKKGHKYSAQIRVNGKIFYLGSFSDPKEAHAAYVNAAIEMKGEFANPGDGCIILKDKNV